jgi:CheY-like chemotaxis protein
MENQIMNAKSIHTGNPDAMREKRVILMVDGDPVSQFYTCVILQRLNYHVIAVRSAEEALVIMELTTPLLVITEITLPQMSGIDLLKRLKQDPRTKNVPVLIYTAIKAEQRDLCQEAGCDGYLLHTSDYNKMYNAVQQATEPKPRHFVRLDTWFEVKVTAPENGGQAALVSAISEHGMFVITRKPLPNGTTAEFTLYMPNAGTNGARVQGKVLYSYADPGLGKNPGMGVKFMRVHPDDSALIKAFIEKKLMNGIVQAGTPSR